MTKEEKIDIFRRDLNDLDSQYRVLCLALAAVGNSGIDYEVELKDIEALLEMALDKMDDTKNSLGYVCYLLSSNEDDKDEG